MSEPTFDPTQFYESIFAVFTGDIANPSEFTTSTSVELVNAFLSHYNVQSAVIITAWNPGFTQTDALNAIAQNELKEVLQSKYEMLTAVGYSSDRKWSEDSFCVLGMTVEDGKAVGRQFGQLAIACLEYNHPLSVQSCT